MRQIPITFDDNYRPNGAEYGERMEQGRVYQGEGNTTQLLLNFPITIDPNWYIQVNAKRKCNSDHTTPIGQFAISTLAGFTYPISGWHTRYPGELALSVTIFQDIDTTGYSNGLNMDYATLADLESSSETDVNTLYYCYDEGKEWRAIR